MREHDKIEGFGMKPESILAHEPQVLTQAQRETYFNDGYLVLEEFIDPKWMKRIWDTTVSYTHLTLPTR